MRGNAEMLKSPSGIPPLELCRLARKAMPLMTPEARAEAETLIAWITENAGESEQFSVFSEGRAAGSERLNTESLNTEHSSKAAAAFEADMQPVREAIVDALEAGDVASLRELRAALPDLLAEVNDSPTLADVMAYRMGAEFLRGIGVLGGEESQRSETGGQRPLASGNAWDPALHPRGGRGRFAEADKGGGFGGGSRAREREAEIKANIQRGRNAMRRVLSEQQDVLNAMERQDVGWIDFVWERLDARGNSRGIKHLLDRRAAEDHAVQSAFSPDETAEKMVEVIARGKIANPHMEHGAVEIDHEGFRVVLARAGKKNNAWLITGFAKIGRSTR